ncbi:ABC transporter permease [Paenibacillus xylanexedens]|uniref:ABC transporter permease n=1 Tax=Paenibacillus xylanexedens TaxID=528191 RepID=UPI0011A93D96|nr:ABC-2 family transporter protein [Paenibacillus xylanexedens]
MQRSRGFPGIGDVKLFLKYFHLTLKVTLQYKFDRSLIAAAVLIRELSGVIILILLLNRFVEIRGWDINEVLFLYSFLFLSYSLFVFFFTGIRDFEDLVYSGEFDRYLVRPVGILFQVVASRVDYTAALGHGVLGIILLRSTASQLQIEWTAGQIGFYLVMLMGGALIQASIFMLASSFCFWTVKVTNLRNMLFFNSRKIAAYPLSFYPGIIQKVLIFVMPFGFVNYFPAQFYLEKPEMDVYWKDMVFLNPLVAAVMFGIVFLVWKQGLRRYSSTGNALY